MARIGILTCSNTTQNVGCSSFKCLQDVYDSTGEFGRYADSGGTQLAGIISCAGCPTAVAPEKLINRVRSLTMLGLDAIHLSSCLMALCPFKNKYASLLEENFPQIEIVRGTHVEPPEVVKMFVDGVKGMLTQPQETMADLAEKARANPVAP
jgi:predicted metal-binding protein